MRKRNLSRVIFHASILSLAALLLGPNIAVARDGSIYNPFPEFALPDPGLQHCWLVGTECGLLPEYAHNWGPCWMPGGRCWELIEQWNALDCSVECWIY